MINAEGEQQAAAKLVEAAEVLARQPSAMQLRYFTALNDIANDNQRAFDALSVELKGKSLDEAKRRVKQEWERDGGEITDPELTEYAELLIDGGRINFNVTPYRFR